jgi:hypothetical protein
MGIRFSIRFFGRRIVRNRESLKLQLPANYSEFYGRFTPALQRRPVSAGGNNAFDVRYGIHFIADFGGGRC